MFVLLHMMPILKSFFQAMKSLVTIHVKFHASLFCVPLGFNFFPENIVGLKFMINLFYVELLNIFFIKITNGSFNFFIDKQPREKLLKI